MQDDKKRLQIRDEQLSPDEEHKIEVKVDKMLSLDSSADSDKQASKKPPKEPEKPIEPVEPPKPKSAPALPDTPEAPEPVDPTAEPVAKANAAAEPDDEIAQVAAEEAASEVGTTSETEAPAENDVPHTDKADTKESDDDQAAQDAEIAAAFKDEPKEPWRARIKHFFAAWWHNRKARWTTIIILILLLVAAGVWQTSRAWALNLVGMRATANVTVLDGTTQLPLQHVHVSIAAASGDTDAQGKVTLAGVKLGKQSLTIQSTAFATIKKNVSIGFGANKLGTLALKAVGTQYHLRILDYATGKPLTKAQASAGNFTAIADSKGNIVLTVSFAVGGNDLPIKVTAAGYRDTKIKVPTGTTAVTTVQMVLAHHEVYVSKQSGKYDVYRSDLDGQNKKLLLAGTGNETDAIQLVPHPTAEEAALVDTRDGTHDSDGYLLQTLTLINVTTGAPTVIDHSEKIQVIDWLGDRVVYAMAKAGASAANPSRYVLMSYDYRTNQRLELDHANSFNDIVSAAGSLYYATSNQYNGGVSQLVKINADNSNKQILSNSEIWNIFRRDYDDFYLAGGDANYTYRIGDSKPASAPNNSDGTNRLYIDSPDGKHSLWVDNRDGKGTLLSYDTKAQKDTILAEADGITYPARWVSNDTVVYRVQTDSETADYVIGLGSNSPKKITDVTNASGRSLWYFY